MSNSIQPFVCTPNVLELAKAFAASEMVPKAYQGKAGNIIVAWEAGHALGLSRMFALQSFAVINGKPSLYGDAPLAIIRASGLLASFEELDAADALDAGEGRCTATRKGGETKTCRFTVEMAKQAGLWGKAGPWQTAPGRMLMFRARGFLGRDLFGDVLGGIGIGEEQDDFTVDATVGWVDVMMPRSKSAPDTEALKAFNDKAQGSPLPQKPAPVAAPTPRQTVTQSVQSPVATSAGPAVGSLYILKGAESKSSQDGKKSWTAVEFDDRDNGVMLVANTFSDTIGALAKSLVGKPVMAELKAVTKGEKTYHNIVSLAAYEEPDDGTPF